MLIRDQVELASQVAQQAPALVRCRAELSDAALRDYWTASKSRFDRWNYALKKHQRESALLGPRWARASWLQLRPLLEEILAGEVLTRVWTAVTALHDRCHDREAAEPVARNIYLGHLEARRRVLELLVGEDQREDPQTAALNRLRARCERWTDVLIGQLSLDHDVCEFAASVERAGDFAESFRRQRRCGLGEQSWNLTLASLRTSLLDVLPSESPNVELSWRITAAILSCYPAELLDATGVGQAVWLTRLQAMHNDAQSLLDELLQLDGASG
jgi:hypothetical protein